MAPFNGGRDHADLEVFEYPRWNTTYHLGQVAYIQTLYGDQEIHLDRSDRQFARRSNCRRIAKNDLSA